MLRRASSVGALRCSHSRNRKGMLGVAAALVVKPRTPPQHEMRVKNSTDATGTSQRPLVELSGKNAPGKCGPAASLHSSSHTKSPASDQEYITLQAHVPIEVRSLGGELVTNGNFQVADDVMAVNDKIYNERHVPCHKQQLFWQDCVLESPCRLEDLNLPANGAVFQLAVRTGPTEQEQKTISEAKQVLAEGCKHLENMSLLLNKSSIPVKLVCQATMHLLAGHAKSIGMHRTRSPKDESWDGLSKMLKDPFFIQHLLDLPNIIEQGGLDSRRIHMCSAHLQDIAGNTESEKVQSLGGDLLGTSLYRYLSAIIKYHGMISLMLQRMGVHGPQRIKELLDWHDNSSAAADRTARRAIYTCIDHLPPGQECSQNALFRKLWCLHSERMTSDEA
mmetsp:Transcript_16586/g.30756  ORF Transcript_16586/g.30756 Transcript_16586/m.30756 type:complete len:391 (-) Transcript_16586:227-1399(-)